MLAFLLSLGTSQWAQAQTFSVLYTFNSRVGDANNPEAGLIRDTAGNLYGTTFTGGAFGGGTVFELSPATGGSWTETILHSFGGTGDGANPVAGLVRDSKGNLYGTTLVGGASNYGTVFRVSPVTGGGWTESVLYSFTGGTDGRSPYYGTLVLSGGYLYGTTYLGGDLSCIDVLGCGVVFRVKATGGHESVLHSFNYIGGTSTDGAYPFGGLIRDAAGNLYGVTNGGGLDGGGVVFELSPAAGGGWTETLLHTFIQPDGLNSMAGLVRDKSGNLFGTTTGSGLIPGAIGTVFEVSSAGVESLPHLFAGPPADGASPTSNLIVDSKGNLYGTTPGGGTSNGGVIFKLTPAGGGWNETILYNFTGGTDGSGPQGTLLRDSAGNLYGTTYVGGAGGGVAFKFHP